MPTDPPSLFDRLLPPALRGSGSEEERVGQLVVVFAVLTGSVHAIASVISTVFRGPNPLAYVLGLGTFGCLLTLPVLWRRPLRIDAIVWLLVVLFVDVSAVAWIGYGFHSPATHVFVLFPVLGMALGGRRLGLGFAALAVVELVSLFAVQRSGHRFPLDASGSSFLLFHLVVQGANLVVVGALLATWDTGWRIAKDRADEAATAVQQANRAKSEFLSHMSHELRTPLNAVLGYVELLQEDARPDQEEDLDRVRSAGRHLLQLVDEVLDLARIESGRVDLDLERCALQPLVEELVASVQPLADDRGNTVDLQLDDVAGFADRLRVRQVVLNLLSNACKFTEKGQITVRLGQTDHQVFLLVTDSGVGMTQDDLERCFRPFEQGEAGRGQGTGLGMPISRMLCERMGGSLTGQSEPGRGTTFEVRLPRAS